MNWLPDTGLAIRRSTSRFQAGGLSGLRLWGSLYPSSRRAQSRLGQQRVVWCPEIGFSMLLAVVFLMAMSHVHAAEDVKASSGSVDGIQPLGLDCAGANGLLLNAARSGSSCRVQTEAVVVTESHAPFSNALQDSPDDALHVTSVLEFEVQEGEAGPFDHQEVDLAFSDDSAAVVGDVYIRRVSTTLAGSKGTLTVGNNWSNFQDFLPLQGGAPASKGLTAEQLSWATQNRLGELKVAVERDYGLVGEPPLSAAGVSLIDGDSERISASPSLSLSWHGHTENQQSQYGISAMGRELELANYENSGTSTTTTGWGLNLFGGWRFGEFFAALSVTLGNSIDSFILGREGNREVAKVATRYLSPGSSVNINPSLHYRLSDQSNLHLSVNRFSSELEDTPHGVETLDTIHLGYSWSPWPSARLGIEFVGKDVEGVGPMEDSNKVNIQASKRF